MLIINVVYFVTRLILHTKSKKRKFGHVFTEVRNGFAINVCAARAR